MLSSTTYSIPGNHKKEVGINCLSPCHQYALCISSLPYNQEWVHPYKGARQQHLPHFQWTTPKHNYSVAKWTILRLPHICTSGLLGLKSQMENVIIISFSFCVGKKKNLLKHIQWCLKDYTTDHPSNRLHRTNPELVGSSRLKHQSHCQKV